MQIALLLLLLAALIIGLLVGQPHYRRWRLERQGRHPFPRAWRQILRRRMPYFRDMPADLQLQLKQLIQVFLAEKTFVGCQGQRITDEIRVLVAAQACLLLLNRDTDYFPKVKTILIYPAAFIRNEPGADEHGLVSDQYQVLAGEAWEFGQVVLSWRDSLEGADDPADGRNLVLHEFAHQLDNENGPANGVPRLHADIDRRDWAATFTREYEQLCEQSDLGWPGLFDPYGATNPAEFFAVVTEVFFEQPQQFSEQHQALYLLLSRYYRVNPLHWR